MTQCTQHKQSLTSTHSQLQGPGSTGPEVGPEHVPGCRQENRGQRAERLATSPQLEGTVADLQVRELPRGATSPLSWSHGSAWKEGHPAERPQARAYQGRALLRPLDPSSPVFHAYLETETLQTSPGVSAHGPPPPGQQPLPPCSLPRAAVSGTRKLRPGLQPARHQSLGSSQPGRICLDVSALLLSASKN